MTNHRKLLFMLVLFLSTYLAIAQAAQAQDITTGLVGHWKLDETSGTTAYDSAGTNNGTLQGGMDAAVNTVGGKVARGFWFDGIDDEVDMQNPVTGDPTTVPFSWSLWTFWQNGVVLLRDQTSMGGQGTFIAWDNNGTVVFRVGGTNGNTGKNTSDYQNKWVHWVLTNDTTTAKLYANGVEIGQVAPGSSGTSALNLMRNGTASAYASGLADDLRVYDRALTADDIDALYRARAAGQVQFNTDHRAAEYFDGSEWVTMGPAALKNGLFGYWKFDEESGEIKDWSGNYNHGTTSGGPEYASSGMLGYAMGFDATDDAVYIGDVPKLDLQERTISAWVYMPSMPTGTSFGRIYSHGAHGGGMEHGMNVKWNGGGGLWKLHFTHNTSGATYSVGMTPASDWFDQWVLVTGTWDGETLKIYRNDTLEGQQAQTDAVQSQNNRTTIGASTLDGASFDSNFLGRIDELRVYNRALSAGEVTTLYEMGFSENLFGRWQLDETSGTTAYNSLGVRNGAMESGLDAGNDSMNGKVGTALDFDGVDDNVNICSGCWAGGSTGTVTAWIKIDSFDTPNAVFSEEWSHSWRGHSLFVDTDGRLKFWQRDGSWNNFVGTPTVMQPGTWYHVAVTSDGADYHLYVNGVNEGNGGAGYWFDMDNGRLRIGRVSRSGTGLNGHFDGQIDDVRVYTRVLTADEIAALAMSCDNPARHAGTIGYNTTHDVMQYCNGEEWKAMGPVPGPGGAGCANPSRPTGNMVFNTNYDVMQYCDGSTWRAVGKNDPCWGSPDAGTLCLDGSYYAGLTPDGNVPMYMADIYSEISSQSWNNGTFNYVVTGFTSTTDGDGNTAGLAASSDSGAPYDAAVYCDDLIAHGRDDWYLPARDELGVIHNGGSLIGDIVGTQYWSSTEIDDDRARLFSMWSGSGFNSDKDLLANVRCVRQEP